MSFVHACKGCGLPLWRRHQQQYCSNACQRGLERQRNIARWLATGDAVTAGSHREHYIRHHLLKEQAWGCAICSCPEEWNDQPLVFVLDHIDGDSTNNRRDNLQLVCPNCDSQLPTFKARNRGNGRAWRRQRYAEGTSY
jgi:hypothetical protein